MRRPSPSALRVEATPLQTVALTSTRAGVVPMNWMMASPAPSASAPLVTRVMTACFTLPGQVAVLWPLSADEVTAREAERYDAVLTTRGSRELSAAANPFLARVAQLIRVG